MEKNNAKISFDAALQMALYAQMERELETMPSPEELKSLYPQTCLLYTSPSPRD